MNAGGSSLTRKYLEAEIRNTSLEDRKGNVGIIATFFLYDPNSEHNQDINWKDDTRGYVRNFFDRQVRLGLQELEKKEFFCNLFAERARRSLDTIIELDWHSAKAEDFNCLDFFLYMSYAERNLVGRFSDKVHALTTKFLSTDSSIISRYKEPFQLISLAIARNQIDCSLKNLWLAVIKGERNALTDNPDIALRGLAFLPIPAPDFELLSQAIITAARLFGNKKEGFKEIAEEVFNWKEKIPTRFPESEIAKRPLAHLTRVPSQLRKEGMGWAADIFINELKRLQRDR